MRLKGWNSEAEAAAKSAAEKAGGDALGDGWGPSALWPGGWVGVRLFGSGLLYAGMPGLEVGVDRIIR